MPDYREHLTKITQDPGVFEEPAHTEATEGAPTTLPEAKTTADSWGTIIGIMLCKDSHKMIVRSNNEEVMVLVWDESDSGEMPPMMQKLRFEVYRDGDDTIYCGACGEEGHTYYGCWSYDSMEGDR